jgi:hypothetical protein
MTFNVGADNFTINNFSIVHFCLKRKLNGAKHDPILTENPADETIH